MIYLDSSALLKLILREPESEALEAWLVDHRDAVRVSSALAIVEVERACRRIDERLVGEARRLLAGLDLVPLDGQLLESAAELPGRTLRSLDALHLASALALDPDLQAFVAYDARLATAATDAGLVVARPGA